VSAAVVGDVVRRVAPHLDHSARRQHRTTRTLTVRVNANPNLLRWAQATNEVSTVKVLGLNNPSDMCTKTNSRSDINHHIDAVMCKGSVLPPRLPGSFSTRESKNRKPNFTGAAA